MNLTIEKLPSKRPLIKLAIHLRQFIRTHGVLLIINDRGKLKEDGRREEEGAE